MFRKWNAYTVYLILSGGVTFLMTMAFTINLVYQATTAHLTPLQLVLVGTAMEVAALIFEVPTGIVADVYSRRLSVMIGYVVLGLGMTVEGSFPRFEMIALGQAIMGLGFTFVSGALDAWLSDEIGEENYGKARLRASQIDNGMALLAMIVSVALASITINLPIVLGGVLLMGLAVFLFIVMPENGFQPKPREERGGTLASMRDTFRDGRRLVRARPVLLTLLLISALFGAFSEGFDRLGTAHIATSFTLPAIGSFDPIVWFGIISVIGMILGIISAEIARRWIDTTKSDAVARALLYMHIGIIGGSLLFALSGNFLLAIVANWFSGVMRGLSGPLISTWLNQNVQSDVRATVLSMHSQCNALGQIAGGPAVGYIGNRFSLRAALSIGALILLPSLPLFARGRRQNQLIQPVAEVT